VKVALDAVKGAASQASTAIEYFTLQMNLAAGVNVSADQAAKILNDSMRDLGTSFKDAADNGGINGAALTTWNVAALTATQQGSALYDSLTKTQTAYATSTVTAYENASAQGDTAAGMQAAAAAADVAYQAFITTATGAGLTADQAQQLATKLGIVQGTAIDPKTFELIAKNEQADKAVSDLQAAQIAPKDVTVNATVQPAQGAFTQLVQQELDNTVKVDADAKAAQGTVNDFVNAKRTTTPVTVPADPSQANSTVNAFTQTQRSTQPVQVPANVAPAQQSINNLVNQAQRLTITVDANTSAAVNAINAVVRGSYTATVNVTANTSAAQAAIASVPRSVTVAPAPAAAGLLNARAFGAPAFTPAPYGPLSFAKNQAPQDVGSVTYEINVSGSLDSPDTIARRVADVLERRDRRMRGVKVQAR
jgi:hypothetical protein